MCTVRPEEQGAELPQDGRFDDADVSTLPFVQHPAYGRGLWRNPVNFVRAASTSPPPAAAPSKAKSLAEAYLAIVLPNNNPAPKPDAYPICGVCNAPVLENDDRAHYLSPVHQGALPTAPAPSAIDRTRMGLKYLEKHGFDVDARVGLGASGQGRLFPIMPKEKRDKLGLGVDRKRIERERKEGLVPKDVRLDAGKVRKLEKVQRRKHESLRDLFYGDDRLEKHLGGRKVDHGLR
ncbi:hypothetical protein P280DRAFT_471723 [Massarina eburnea CBS 473.64]|uniref:G-patch domain-containing protein n=1 Tax=Massarina eburnea CBS 473.64 TaxID=1395130 RepID=A0A6A6RSH6_9PLEO|nr:hypothetical protein P280DRAFT_471723 [Massarina eburnea CBS 473.64]